MKIENQTNVLQEALQPEWDETRTAKAREGVARLHRRFVLWRGIMIGGSVAVTALLLIGFFMGGMTQEESASLPIASLPAAIHFSDGSKALPSSPDVLMVERSSDTLIQLRLKEGRSRFQVTPNKTRNFVVDTGHVKVIVLGTTFAVEHSPNAVIVEVTEGKVRVEAANSHWILATGERGVFPQKQPSQLPADPTASEKASNTPEKAPKMLEEVSQVKTPQPTTKEDGQQHHPPPKQAPAPAAKATPAPRPVASSKSTPQAPTPRPKTSTTPGWRQLAAQGALKDAAQSLLALSPDLLRTPDDLMKAADVLRLAGYPVKALTYLEKMETRYPTHAQTPFARFWRGRIMLNTGQACGAATLFARIQTGGKPAGLLQDALAREVDAWARCGQRAKASSRGKFYLKRYPNGHYASAVRRHITSEVP